jgi:hypothetical protein
MEPAMRAPANTMPVLKTTLIDSAIIKNNYLMSFKINAAGLL